MSTNATSKIAFSYSFSGTDISNSAWFDYYTDSGDRSVTVPVNLTSLSTISFSIHESKSPVRSLGNKNVSGYTSSIRTIAGSMILSLVNRHPLSDLVAEYYKVNAGKDMYWGWSRDFNQNGKGTVGYNAMTMVMPTSLAPFNMIFTAVPEIFNENESAEHLNYASCALFGIEFVEDSTIFSVNNILTEMSFTFVARDYAVLDQSSTSIPKSELLARAQALKAPTSDSVDKDIANELSKMKGIINVTSNRDNLVKGEELDRNENLVFSGASTLRDKKWH
jgi:hypothetical protein